MKLRTSLMLRVSAAALLCLAAAIAIVVVRADQAREADLAQRTERAAAHIGNQIQTQKMLRGGKSAFGSIGTLLEGASRPGECASLLGLDEQALERHCVGSDLDPQTAPAWFTALFAGRPTMRRDVRVAGARHGAVSIEADPRHEAAQAWERVAPLAALGGTTVAAMWLLLCFGLRRELRPLSSLVDALENLGQGAVGARLVPCGTLELDRIAESFNRLSEVLARRTAERDELTRRLIGLQDAERRHLARELHDEFGQCLAAVNAIAASIAFSTQSIQPGAAAEARRIGQLVGPMMHSLRAMLLRLHPPGIDEFGLESCLRNMVADWNGRGSTRFAIDVAGTIDDVPPSVAMNVFRVVQESLTNAVKHAAASRVSIRVHRAEGEAIRVTVEDDGVATAPRSAQGVGFGISGMRERVAALGGHLETEQRAAGGFVVRASIPFGAV